MKKLLILSLFTFTFSLFTPCIAQYTNLHNFAPDTLGATPFGSLTLSKNGDTLFGMASGGGKYGNGCIFATKTNGSGYVDLFDFNGTNGSNPQGSLTLSVTGDTLFGMTYYGGASGQGNIFSIQTNGNNFNNMVSFSGTGSYPGSYPMGSLTLSVTGDSLFGMAQSGGRFDDGIVFAVKTDGSGYDTLISFDGVNGYSPQGSLTLSPNGNVLFGMTFDGGKFGNGNIFSINTSGTQFDTLFSFVEFGSENNGQNPIGSLTLSITGDTLFGMTLDGGHYYSGNVFSIDTDGTHFNDIHDFNGSDGYDPYGSLILINGDSLFGTTSGGGTYSNGVIFSLPTMGGSLTTLFNFNGLSNGGNPWCSLTLLNGDSLAGTTTQGGTAASLGTMFTIQTNGNSFHTPYTWVHSDGANPVYGNIAISGNVGYGMVKNGGLYGYGMIYSINTDGSNYKDLHDFNNLTWGGDYPTGSLTFSITGDSLYGMTVDGGKFYDGVIFSIKTDGTGYDTLLSFTGSNGIHPGSYPYGSLTLKGDTLFGMTYTGGAVIFGTAFSVQTNGANFHTMINFNGSGNGQIPYGNLTLSVTGDSLFGMTSNGGTYGDGTMFSIQTNGTHFHTMENFWGSISPKGANPYGSLTLVHGDTLFGMTYNGGNGANKGNVFMVLTNGNNYTDLYEFNGSPGGSNPYSSLTYSGGILYGTTAIGGTNSDGNIFSIQTNGTAGGTVYTDVYDFTGASGLNAESSLTLSNGVLYGMTNIGGTTNAGVVFGYKINCTLTTTASVTANTCNLASTGIAMANPGNGTPTYAYLWSDGNSQTTASATGLSAGTYTVTVTDFHGCAATAPVTITSAAALTSGAITTQNATACSNSGIATATPSNGISPYTYLWTDGSSQTTVAATGLSAGTYTVTVTDQCSGSATAPVTITAPATLTVGAGVNNNTTECLNIGSATAIPGGGTTPYTYLWSDGSSQITPAATGLSAGTYTVTLSDANNCSATAPATITAPPTLTAGSNVTANTTECSNLGSATAIPGGGVTPYTYVWSANAGYQTTIAATGLSAGTYTVVVGDANFCGASTPVTITAPATLTATTYAVDSNGGNCIAAAVPSGGLSPYTYAWSLGGATTDTIKGLSAGTYTCTVTDANNCSATALANILPTGINKITAGSGNISIYPNPSNGVFTIQSSVASSHPDSYRESVEVYNVLGQQVYSQFSIYTSTFNINLGSQPDGVYLYRVLNSTGGLLGEGKIVIQK